MKSLAQVLEGQRYLKGALSDIDVGRVLQSNWQDIFGKLADSFVFGGYRKKAVTVYTSNPMWAKEIKFYTPDLISKMNRLFRQRQTVKWLTVRFDPKLKRDDSDETPESDQPGDLLGCIRQDVARKRDDGAQPCVSCQEVLTVTQPCTFCRCAKV